MKAIRLILLAATPLAPSLFAADTVAKVPEKSDPAKPAPRRTLVQLASEKRALATRLVEALKLREQMDQNTVEIHRNLDGSFDQVLHQSGPAGTNKELVEQYRARVHKLVKEALVWENISGDVIQACSTAYNEQELKDINAFLMTPSGRTFAAKFPQLGASLSGIALKRMVSIQPQIQSAIYEMSLEIQRRAVPDPKAAATGSPNGK